MGFVAKQIGGSLGDLVLTREGGRRARMGRMPLRNKTGRISSTISVSHLCQQVAHSCPGLRNLRLYLRQSFLVHKCQMVFCLILREDCNAIPWCECGELLSH